MQYAPVMLAVEPVKPSKPYYNNPRLDTGQLRGGHSEQPDLWKLV